MREGNPRLRRAKWEPVWSDPANVVYFSIVNLWEIAIKRSLGKLELEGSLEDFSQALQGQQGFRLLPIDVPHLSRLETLPSHHGDPFDRLLIAQALELGAHAVTDDPQWRRYAVKCEW
jgi:PIN domain nuclease of toxin-antitoxin system